MSNTPQPQRPEALTALDNMAKPGGDNVSPQLRAAASLTSPEANGAIKMMTAGDGKAMAAFAGAGDCSINGSDTSPGDKAAVDSAIAQLSHTVSGERNPDSTVGNDTRYSASATGDNADVARQLANAQADQLAA